MKSPECIRCITHAIYATDRICNLLIYSATSTFKVMEGEILTYQTDSDDEHVGADVSIDPHRWRGKGRSWSFVRLHDNLQSGFTAMNNSNVPLVTRLKGRNNRGKTAAYYFDCVKKSCGCTKQWRLVTALDSLLVREEETSEDHSFHENFLRNGGRGMSTEQVAIVDEAFRLNIKKPKAVLDYFVNKALQNPTAGESCVLHKSFINHYI
jgi:hypothetical protein